MKRMAQRTVRMLMMLSVVSAGPALAQDYAIDRHTVDGGGVMFSIGGEYELSGTIGQPDAGEMAGGTYGLTGGFWFGCVPGDCDCDGDVDLYDFADFQVCLHASGPGGGLGPGCGCFDFEDDGDIDLHDFARFQVAYEG